jgi:hypothetical protein
MFEEDIAESEELHLDKFVRRSIVTRILERMAYSFRHWL